MSDEAGEISIPQPKKKKSEEALISREHNSWISPQVFIFSEKIWKKHKVLGNI